MKYFLKRPRRLVWKPKDLTLNLEPNLPTMWILPQTSKVKDGIYYHQYEFDGKPYAVILSQIRTISSKRLIRKIRTYPKDDFKIIKDKVVALIKNDPRH